MGTSAAAWDNYGLGLPGDASVAGVTAGRGGSGQARQPTADFSEGTARVMDMAGAEGAFNCRIQFVSWASFTNPESESRLAASVRILRSLSLSPRSA